MKKLQMFSLFALIALFGCSDDDNANVDPNTNIISEWTLLKTTGTIAGITHEFPNGMIVWKFDQNNTVTITNNNTEENLQSGFPSGTYNYTISDNPLTASCQQNITINLEEFGCFAVYENEMDINQNIADGINYHFEKVVPFTTN